MSSSVFTFLLITAAEMGDKSQIVCMTLAAKHKAKPVFWGSVLAFLLLNAIAVALGASLSTMLPMNLLTAVAAVMFTIFGLQALLSKNHDEDASLPTKLSRSIFITAFSIIFIAEMGDKTQLAVASLSTTENPLMVWISASVALIVTTAIGVFAGSRWLAKLNINTVHKLSGCLFLLFALFATIRLFNYG